jgi:hypothetical protein
MQTSGDQRREIAKSYQHHCERSEAIHYHLVHRKMDCFASLSNDAERPQHTGSPNPTGSQTASWILQCSKASRGRPF